MLTASDAMRFGGLHRNLLIGRGGLRRDLPPRTLGDGRFGNGAIRSATGNLVFDAGDKVGEERNARLGRLLGRRTPVIVRDASWMVAFGDSDLFRAFPRHNGERVLIPQRLDDVPLRLGA